MDINTIYKELELELKRYFENPNDVDYVLNVLNNLIPSSEQCGFRALSEDEIESMEKIHTEDNKNYLNRGNIVKDIMKYEKLSHFFEMNIKYIRDTLNNRESSTKMFSYSKSLIIPLFKYTHGENNCIHMRLVELNKAKVIACDKNFKPLEGSNPEIMHILELMKIIKDNKQITLSNGSQSKKHYLIDELIIDTTYLDRENVNRYIYNCMFDNRLLRNTTKYKRDYEVLCSKSNEVMPKYLVKGNEDIQLLRFLCICTLFVEIRTEQDDVIRNLLQDIITETIDAIPDCLTKKIFETMVKFIRKNCNLEVKNLKTIFDYDYISLKQSNYYESILHEMIYCIFNIPENFGFDINNRKKYTNILYDKFETTEGLNMANPNFLSRYHMR